MGNISEAPVWDDNVYQIETTDPLLGGPDGEMNFAAQNLANRTLFLKRAIEGFVSVQNFSVSHVFTNDEIANNFILIDADSSSLSFTLPVGYLGARAVIKAVNVNLAQVIIRGNGTTKIILDGNATGATNSIYLGDGDSIELVLTALGWLVYKYQGNFDDIGGIIHRYKQLPNTVIANGQLLNRSNYPRLWSFAQSLGASLVSDITWSNPINHGFFSTGNGTTTFRVPDLRGMFLRGLDLGAGVDLGRTNTNPGGYEDDDIKSHTHGLDKERVGGGTTSEVADGSGLGSGGPGGTTASTGGLETRPKNIGFLPLIKI